VVTQSVTPVRMSRWAILGGYGLLAACSQLLWLSFAPVTTQELRRDREHPAGDEGIPGLRP
jgi:hypothetical protein